MLKQWTCAAVLLVGLFTQACGGDDTDGTSGILSPPPGPSFIVTFQDGGEDQSGRGYITTSRFDGKSPLPEGQTLIVLGGGYGSGGGHSGWELAAVANLDAVMSGQELSFEIVSNWLSNLQPGEAFVREWTSRTTVESASSGTVTMRLNYCQGWVEGRADADPESYNATFVGPVARAEDPQCAGEGSTE